MRSEKATMLDEVRRDVSGKVFVILADYTGLNVAKTTDLRSRLRGANAKYTIVKNRLLNIVADEARLNGLSAGMEGPTAIVSGDGDVVEAAKILKQFIKENEKPVIKIGAFSGAVLTPAEIELLASMPPRIELLGRVVGTIAAPMTSLVGVMNQKLCSLVYVLKAVQEKKEKAA